MLSSSKLVLLVLVFASVAVQTSYGDDCGTPGIGGLTYQSDATGAGTLSLDYTFPNSNGGNYVQIWIDGSVWLTGYPSAQSGHLTMSLSSTCWSTGGHLIEALAVSCGRWQEGQYKAVTSTTVTVNTTPTVTALTYIPTDAEGHGTLSADYDFPNTDTSANRWLQLWIDGVAGSPIHMANMSGTWTTALTTTCWTTGDHRIEVLAVACDRWSDPLYKNAASTSLQINTTPRITGLTATLDDYGDCSLTADYEFPNTDSANRWLQLWIDGVPGSPIHMQQESGTWTGSLSTACMTQGTHHFDLLGVACDRWQDDLYKNAAATNIEVNHKPAIQGATLAVPMRPDFADLTLQYRFPQTATSDQRTITLTWLPSKTTSASVIATEHPPDIQGTAIYAIPRQRHDEMIEVRLTGCGSEVAAQQLLIPKLETECCCGAVSCQGDPIHVGSANMRYTDREPLPGDFSGAFARTYDSNNEDIGLFGARWSTPFDAWLRTYGSTVILGTSSNGRVVFEQRGNSYTQIWPSGSRTLGTLTASGNGLDYRAAGSDVIDTYSGGRLVTIRRLSTSSRTLIAYDAGGLPMTVTDADGTWQWNVTTNATLARITAISVAGRPDIAWHYNYDASGTLQSVTVADGSAWRAYQYNSNGLLTAALDPQGNSIETHDYSASGQALTSTGPSGDITGITFGENGRVPGEMKTRVTSSSGKISTYYIRYIAGRARTVQVNGGCSCGSDDMTYGYDASGHIVLEQDARGYLTRRTWDAAGAHLIESSGPWQPAGCDPATSSTHCRLTPDSILTTPVTATTATLTTSYVYGDPNWPDRATSITTNSVTSGNTRTESNSFDSSTGTTLVHSVTGWTGAASETHTTTRSLYSGTQTAAFDPCNGTSCAFLASWLTLPQPAGRMALIDGPRTDVSDVTQYVYYPLDNSVSALLRGRLAAIRNAVGQIIRYESYDVFGNAGRVVDANGVATTATFDALGQRITTTINGVAGCDTSADPLCATDLTSVQTYVPSSGPLGSQSDALGNTTTFEYDARGRLSATSRGPSAPDPRERMETSYDAATGLKNLQRYLNKENGSWVEKRRESFAYDQRSQLITQTHSDGTSVGYTYESGGAVATVRDENHTTANTRYSYDAALRLSSVSQTLSTAPGGNITTTYSYDLSGNLTGVTDPNGNITTYVYDDFGRMLSQTSPVTGTTSYTYDPSGNLITTTDANGVTTTRTYDALNRVLSATASGASTEATSWNYDGTAPFARGRLASMTDPTGSTSYTHERRGALQREQKTIGGASYTTAYQYDSDGNRSLMTYPSGRTVSYTFDFANRPLAATSGTTNIVSSASYLPFGPATQFIFGNGTTKTMTYDSRYRILENKLTSSAGVIADYNYAEDPAGNITQIHDAADPAFNRDFGYDDLNRLTTATAGASLWGNGTYQYDSMGNLSSLALGVNRNSSFAYSGNTPKLSSVATNGTPQSVQYDAAGNETQADGQTFHYSPRNTLADTGLVSYGYDGRGVRAITSYPASYLSTLQVTPTVLYTNQSATGTVTLAAAAPSGGVVVHLAASSSTLTLPATVTVPAGGTSAVFGISQAAGGQTGPVTITASYLFTATATVSITAGPSIATLAINPTTVAGGGSATGTVTLSAAAPSGGAPVLLSSDLIAATVPAQVTITAGQTESTFTVETSTVTTPTTAHINATYNGTASADLSIVNGVASVSINPSSVTGGAGATGTVALMAAAPAGGASVSLVSSTPSVATVPPTVAVPAGATTATFAIASSSVTTGLVATITASLASSSANATLTVNPCVLTEAAQPDIPTGDTVWIEDTTPAGWSGMPDVHFTTSQKASGTQSLHIGQGAGAFGEDGEAYASPLAVNMGDKIVFYMLLNPCAPPREVKVEILAGGWHTLWWGEALMGGETNGGSISMGSLPAAGTWARIEVPASTLHIEGVPIEGLFLARYDGEVWFDHFGKNGLDCTVPVASAPTIPTGDTVWIDDTMPAGWSGMPDIQFTTSQKASGTQSLHIGQGAGAFGEDGEAYASPLAVNMGDKIVFYMLLNPCAPPREVKVEILAGGWRTLWWGEALMGGETDGGSIYMGSLPAAGTWARIEVPASTLHIEGVPIQGLFLARYDGEIWFDHFGKNGLDCTVPVASAPTIPTGDTVWIEDTTPAGWSGMPDVHFTTSQKASGTQSLHIGQGAGAFGEDGEAYASPLAVNMGDKIVFYMLLNPCAPPREVKVEILAGGWHTLWWGEALMGGETNGGSISMGSLPAAGTWARIEVPASTLHIEGVPIEGLFLARYDGEVWFDHFGKNGLDCTVPVASAPTIPTGDTVWIDDTMPAGWSGMPDIQFTTSQKASGTQSLHIGQGAGAFGEDGEAYASPLAVNMGDKIVFYMLLNPCAPPREVKVEILAGGWRTLWWGEALMGGETDGGSIYMGSLPAAGTWARIEVPASTLHIEGVPIQGLFLARYDGEIWFDHFGTAPTSSSVLSMEPPEILLAIKTNPKHHMLLIRLFDQCRRAFSGMRGADHPISLSVRGDFVARSLVVDDAKRYSLYTPELNLMAETEVTTAAIPAIAYEYVWFGGQPVAQFDTATNTPHWTFTDHLGTPILQTNAADAVDWRVEYEPYGTTYTIRSGAARHQPLRFPGQEFDEASPSQSYNIFRWYRQGWGRYTQADPIRLSGGLNLYGYASGDPVDILDRRGLKTFNWSWGGPPHPSSDPAGDCQRPGQQRPNTKVSCTNFLGASLDCVCGCGGSGWEPHVTLHVSLEMYVLNGPIRPGMAHDPLIHSFNSAVDHELNKHVMKGVDAVRRWMDGWMKDSYASEDECKGVCTSATNVDPSGIFSNAFNKSAVNSD
jgi:RHS repeat-associated protein